MKFTVTISDFDHEDFEGDMPTSADIQEAVDQMLSIRGNSATVKVVAESDS